MEGVTIGRDTLFNISDLYGMASSGAVSWHPSKL